MQGNVSGIYIALIKLFLELINKLSSGTRQTTNKMV